jgi:hypothetical protein
MASNSLASVLRGLRDMEEILVRDLPDAALDRSIQRAKEFKADEQQITYDRGPAPGAPPHTGHWKNDQSIEGSGSERTLLPRGPSAAYEERLSDLPTGRDGINRTNPAAQRARDRTEADIENIVADVVRELLR